MKTTILCKAQYVTGILRGERGQAWMRKTTKIICTMGLATDTEGVLAAII